MDENIEAQFSDELDPNEKLQWTGKPYSGIHFNFKDFEYVILNYIVPFVILLVLLIYFNSILSFIDLWIVILLICVFAFPLLIGLINTLIIEPIIRKKISYIISDRRIIIKNELKESENKSINLDSIKEINLQLYKNGRGTIQLENRSNSPWIKNFRASKYFFSKRKFRGAKLELLEDVFKVYDLIKKLQWNKNNV